LDLHKNNWMEWSHQIDQTLHLSGLGGYIDGHIKAPDASLNLVGYNNWVSNNEAVTGLLSLRATQEERRFILEAGSNAMLAWSTLCNCHIKQGPLAQITLIEDAFTTHYSASEPYAVTSERLAQLVHHIWAIGIPTEELFLSIVMLNALSPHLPNVRDHVATELAKATDASPLTPAVIQTRLVFEQQLVDHAKATQSGVDVLAVQTLTGAVCTHCKCKGHLVASCWGPGGPMEGRCDEVLAAKAAKWNGKGHGPTPAATAPAATVASSVGSTGARAVKCYDDSGRAYLLDPITRIAYLCESIPAETASLVSATVHTAEATILHVNATPTVTTPDWLAAYSDAAGDRYEYEAFLTLVDSFDCSLDWHKRGRTDLTYATLASLPVYPVEARGCTPLQHVDAPFYLDSGATTHVSPERSDFIDLWRVPPSPIWGVGGSTIHAIGIGRIKL
ncbi:hypothetical protein NEOLEDRAFT_1031456, partial [Neolentinus lepideus HHB14362 ss-1]